MALALAMAASGWGLLGASAGALAQSAPVLPMALWGTVTTAGGAPVTQGTVQAFLGGAPAGGQGVAVSGAGSFGGGAGTEAQDLDVQGAATDAGQPVSFSVGGLAASVTAVSCTDASGQPGPDSPFVWESGYFCQVALTVAGQPPSAPLTNSLAAGPAPGQNSVTVGGSGTAVPEDSVTASGGTGTAAIGTYASDPEGGAATPFQAGGSFFDVSLSPGSTFGSVTIQACGVPAGQQLYWWTGAGWAAVSPQSYSGGCLVAQLGSTSSPTVAQLTGTPFAAAAPGAAGGSGGGGGGGGVPAPAAVPPAVSGLTPAVGPAAGGTSVVISGSGFTGATAVDFGGTPAASFAVDSDARITAVSPAGTAGETVDVTVTTPAGTSAAGPADRFTYAAAAAENAVTFSDVPPSHWAYASIEALAARGIVSGFPDGTFRPDASVTRAQFVKMLVLTLGVRPGSPDTPFGDVPPSAWYAPYVSAAVRAGIVDGLTPTAFGPDDTLTREQMAVLLARALKLGRTATLRFSDDGTIAPWAATGVKEAVAAGLMDGFPDGTFQPLGATTRAQAAKVLAMVLAGRATAAAGGG